MSIFSSCTTRYRVTDVLLGIGLWPLPLMLIVAACAGSAPVQKSTTPPASVSSFDGSYRNTIRVTGTASEATGTNWCATPGQSIVTISSGQFSYAIPHPNVPGNPTPTFQAAMSLDGSFSGQANNGTIAGQVRGPHIEGTINGEGCIYAFTGDRI